MEAYQIEYDYGSSSEAFEHTLSLEEWDSRRFIFFRFGRVGLFFQSEDAQITGRWDNGERRWVQDDSIRNEVRKGLRMANELIAPEIVVLPVSAPSEAS
jgi:hypothetical protein